MTEQQLVDLKKSIDSAKQKRSELKGKRKALMESLQSNFGCKTVQEAEKKIEALEEQIEQLEKEKQDGIREIEENYEF